MHSHLIGHHLLIDGFGVDPKLLNNRLVIEQALRDSATAGEVELLRLASHCFEPQGVTAFALLSESHISIHTWPERGFFAADLFFCGGQLDAAAAAILHCLKPASYAEHRIPRGAAKPHTAKDGEGSQGYGAPPRR
ncbi:MAG: adenosylmethionine decarboxylase [Proteobacteria bacterium]|nr:adenosylmethionine decarboxylase [Pseudomonadota bacterium]